MNNTIDQLCMLLSTDWFEDKWHLLGVQASRSSCREMQQRCRRIVAELFGGKEDYWLVSFEDDRLRKTYELFFSAAGRSSLEKPDIDRFKSILDDSSTGMAKMSLIENLTLLLIAKSDDEVLRGLPRALADKVASIVARQDEPPDLISEMNASTTPWDLGMQKRTSGLPEYLGDFAVSSCSKLSGFGQTWSHLMKELSKEDKARLIAWYREMGKELTGQDIELTAR